MGAGAGAAYKGEGAGPGLSCRSAGQSALVPRTCSCRASGFVGNTEAGPSALTTWVGVHAARARRLQQRWVRAGSAAMALVGAALAMPRILIDKNWLFKLCMCGRLCVCSHLFAGSLAPGLMRPVCPGRSCAARLGHAPCKHRLYKAGTDKRCNDALCRPRFCNLNERGFFVT